MREQKSKFISSKMKFTHYESLPGSQSPLQRYFGRKKIINILVALFSVTVIALVVIASLSTSNSKVLQLERISQALDSDSNIKSIGSQPQLTAKRRPWVPLAPVRVRKYKTQQPQVKSTTSPSSINNPNDNTVTDKPDRVVNPSEDFPYNFVKREALIVRTKEGLVEGTTLKSRAGRNFAAFYNIPYARPPVGQLRFKDPEPPQSWEGIRDSKKIGPQCIQKEKYVPYPKSTGEEDCLYLNVYTPKLPQNLPQPTEEVNHTESKLNATPSYPVLFYIHGGGFNSGNGSRYGPDYFMDENVIIVTFEFRLGAFGFISTGDMEIRGNMGFKDSILALRWVQRNIAAFGGDPKRVTIFGNSSGAMHVHALLLSNMSKGLFHGAISQSGAAISQVGGTLPFPPLQTVVNIAIEVGCNSPNVTTKQMVDCLRNVDAKDLAVIENPFVFFFPTLEPIPEDGDLSNVFYERHPYKAMDDADNYPMKVPWIIGDNSGEELSATLKVLKNPEQIRGLNENWLEAAPKTMLFRHRPSDEKLKSIRKFYFGRHIQREIGNETRFELLNMLSDHKWVHATKLAALAHAKHSPVFLYWLSKEPSKSYAEALKKGFTPPFGVDHADELQYFFPYNGFPEIPLESPFARFSQKLIYNWAEFAATGVPALAEWTPIDPAQNGTVWFRLDDCDKTGMTGMLKRRINFWNDFTQELFE